MGAKALFFFALLCFSAASAFAENEEDTGLVMNFYQDTCPQAEDIIKEQVKLLYKRHKNTAFSWLRNIFHDCCSDSTRRSLSEKETDRSFGLRNFRYIEDIKEAVERECRHPGVVSCADILVLSAREGIVLSPEVDPELNPDHIPHLLHKCPDQIPDPKAVQYVRNDRGTPMVLDNNNYRNILDNKGLLIVDHQLAYDKRTRPYVKKMAKSQDYFFKEFSRAITLLSENNPLTRTKGDQEAVQSCKQASLKCFFFAKETRLWPNKMVVGRTHCVKLVHRLYSEVGPELNPDHIPHMLHKCTDQIPVPKAVQYVRNDRGTPMVLDNNYYRNILDNKGLLIVDHQLAYDKRTRPYVKKMAKSQDYFFTEFSRAITLLSESNPHR
ncbi:Peroxidase 42 [Hibiscus syriacus]|uniref:Peroxidase n=1 Tax=Hibiscus syriacus TaxID=106335 RepID=A0A6A2XJE1_HIBSY|nr:Peroxidase 42 [Hibiscus syriacus]